MADVAASVLAKLRNKAKASGISYQQCLQLFVQEEFLRKLSKSGCEDTLILKGGLFIYTLTNFESRATIDVDFLLRGYSNSIDDVKELICKIIDTPTGNDYIEMRAKGFEEISPQRKYHGISTQIIAQIKNVRVPFNVDIGVGDIIVPRAEERTINTQLPDFEAPVIKTYSLESTIAEKFDAILQRFELTGRMKDFYDIYYLSIIGHTGDYNDVEKLSDIVKRGSYLGLDRFGLDEFNSLDNRVNTLDQLCQKGLINSLVVSHDIVVVFDADYDDFSELPRKRAEGRTFNYFCKKVVPLLEKRGYNAADIEKLLVDNPKQFFDNCG